MQPVQRTDQLEGGRPCWVAACLPGSSPALTRRRAVSWEIPRQQAASRSVNEAATGAAGGTAVAQPSPLDELAHDDQGGLPVALTLRGSGLETQARRTLILQLRAQAKRLPNTAGE